MTKMLAISPFLRRILLTGLAFWVPVAALIYLANEILEKSPPAADIHILMRIHAHHTAKLDSFFKLITNFGSTPVVIILTIGVFLGLFLAKRQRDSLLLAISVTGAAMISALVKHWFGRPRPQLWAPLVHEASFSFPSGHATGSAVLIASVIVIAWPTRWRWPVVGLGLIYAVAIGLSRLYLGVHYPSDVLGGWLIAVIWVYLVNVVIRRSFKSQLFKGPNR